MRLRPSLAGVIGTCALVLASTGTAVAATGGSFVLGRANSANATTTLTNTAGTPLSLAAAGGRAPLAVNNTTKVSRLNSDLLDGLDSTQLQRKVAGSCQPGYAVRAINANGSVVCDDEAGDLAEVTVDFTGGSGRANCPEFYVVTGGGYTTAGSVPGIPTVARPYTDQNTLSEYFAVNLVNADGSPFTGGGTVTARCEYGYVGTAPNGPALKARH